MSSVTVYHCSSYDSVGTLVEEAFERFTPPLEGKRVLLKPNLLGPCPPREHVTTHPSLVSAAIASCRRRGAAEVTVGDNPGMSCYGSTDQVARVTGIFEAAGKCYQNIAENPRTVEGLTPGAERLPISRVVLEADVVVGLAKAKTHVATGITGAVKNTFGYVVGAAKTRIHAACPGKEAFARAILDVYALRPPDFSIIDAVYAMEGQGPSGGRPRFVGRLLASADNVALDAVLADMMGFAPGTVPYLVVAAKRGLGETDLGRIEIDGPAGPIRGFRRPTFGLAVGTWFARWMSHLFVTQPRADRQACVKCGACCRQCPVEAIRMDPCPVIDAGLCISCFCCHEFCKHKAMRLAPRVRMFKFFRGRS
ncbi:MAG: DUF362 domain-containing protein [Anaerolineaceae bacterium]|nr:DUF362 domain-containing protein [Anaerolineaceae bacterium]